MHYHSFNMYLSSLHGPGPGLALRTQWCLRTWLKSLRVEIQSFSFISQEQTPVCTYLLWLWITWAPWFYSANRKLPFFVLSVFSSSLLFHSHCPLFAQDSITSPGPYYSYQKFLGDDQDRWPLMTLESDQPESISAPLLLVRDKSDHSTFLLYKTEIITSTLFKWLN